MQYDLRMDDIPPRAVRLARILIGLFDLEGLRRVRRQTVRSAWLRRYPEDRDSRLRTDYQYAKAATRYGDEAHDSVGTYASKEIKDALRTLDKLEITRREGDAVVILDVHNLRVVSLRPDQA